MTTGWVRATNVTSSLPFASRLFASLTAGQSYLRVRIRWGVHFDTPVETDMSGVAANIITFGLVTTIGNGTETPPNPRLSPGDAAPPTQRWIYWETRAVVPYIVNVDAGLTVWRDTGSTEETSTKGQVLATGLGSNPYLNLWGVWASPSAYPPGNLIIWSGLSILAKIS